MPRLASIKERLFSVKRLFLQPEQPFDLRSAIYANDSYVIMALTGVPPVDWRAGDPSMVFLRVNDRLSYEAPLDILRADWKRYESGATITLPLPIAVPAGVPATLQFTGWGPPVTIDVFHVATNKVADVDLDKQWDEVSTEPDDE